nr:AAA family ATPase [Streptomyces sp. SID12501]
MNRRFQVLTSSSLEPSYDCAFSREAAHVLRTGLVRHGQRLFCPDLRDALVIRGSLPHQPVFLGFDGGEGDSELWLARNRAPSALRDELRNFQPTTDVDATVAATTQYPLTVVRAPAGAGKTTLLAALTRPELERAIPRGFVQALHELQPADTAESVSRALIRQLRETVPGFKEACAGLPELEQGQLLREALERLGSDVPVRIVLDGLDQLRADALPDIRDLVSHLIWLQDQRMPGVRALISTRPEITPPWPQFVPVDLVAAHQHTMEAYLDRRGVHEDARPLVIERSGGNWLVGTLLADWLVDDYALEDLPTGVNDTYTKRLRGILGGEPWEGSAIKAVLTVLAVASGTLGIPQRLLGHAAGKVHRSADQSAVLTALVRLNPLIVTHVLDSGESSYALFHPTLPQYLSARNGRPTQEFDVDTKAGHRAVAEALRALAPRGMETSEDPLYDYAAEAEALHLWEQSDTHGVVQSLIDRVARVPQSNLQRWSHWLERFELRLAPDDFHVLTARAGVANWTDACGDFDGALTLFEELVDDLRGVFAPDHPNAVSFLELRREIADWFGFHDPAMALGLHQELVTDYTRTLGPYSPDTLAIRNNTASWTNKAGDPAAALDLWHKLLADSDGALSSGHGLRLTIRNGIAISLARTERIAAAVAAWGTLLEDVEGQLGADSDLAGHIRANIVRTLSPLVPT